MPDHWNSLASLLGTPSLAPQNRKSESGVAAKPVVPAPASPAVTPPAVAERVSEPIEAVSEPIENTSGKPEKSRLKSSWDAVASFFGVAASDTETKADAATGGSDSEVSQWDGRTTDSGLASRGTGKKTKPSMWGAGEDDPPAKAMAPVNAAPFEPERPRSPSPRASEPRGQEMRSPEVRGFEGNAAGVRVAEGRDRSEDSESGIGSDRRSHRRLPRRGRGESPELEFAPRGTGIDEGAGGKSGFGAGLASQNDSIETESKGSEGQSGRRDSERGRRERRPSDRDPRGNRDRKDAPVRDESDRKEIVSREERAPSSRRREESEPDSERSASETRRGGRRTENRSDETSSETERNAVPRERSDDSLRRGPRSGQPRTAEPRTVDRGDRVERGDRDERTDRVERSERGDRSERGRAAERSGSDRPRTDRSAAESPRKPQPNRGDAPRADSSKESRRGGAGGFGAGIHHGSRDEFVEDDLDDRLAPGDFEELVDDRDSDDRDVEDRDLDDRDDSEGARSRGEFGDTEEGREKRPRRRRRRGGKDRDRDVAEDASRPKSQRREDERDGQRDEGDDDAEEGIRISKIPSWTETILVVVEANIANHQRAPQGGRGPSRGRGRR